MTRPASARRRAPAPTDLPMRLPPSAIETDPDELERSVSERDADLRAERMLLVREACIVLAILVGLMLLQSVST